MDLSNLIKLAENLIIETAPDALLSKMEEYGREFERWYSSNQERLKNNPETFGDEIFRLSELHESVLEKAAGLRTETSADLQKLRLKGKGLIAYTDLMPKRVGMMKPKKG